MPSVSMKVNGKDVKADVDPRTLLVQFLRENLRLTGTHVGCDTSQCGACVVIVNGKAVKSCTMLALSADGADVLTIEGLANGAQLHPMQEAFREHHALQCGFCTPGMILTAVDMVHRKGNNLEERTIREELEGNICRCTGYHNIVKAIGGGRQGHGQRRVTTSRRIERPTGGSTTPGGSAMSATGIGASVRRKEDFRFITGKGQYTDDVTRPAQTHIYFIRSPHAHAKIRRIDTKAAAGMPGVVGVATGAEFAESKLGNLICGWTVLSKDGSPMKMAPHPALAVGKACHVGDPVAVVVADTLAAGQGRGREGCRRLRGVAGGGRSRQGRRQRRAADPRGRAQQHDLQLAPGRP